MKTYVYWIRLPEHSDILKQGYVGITNNVKKRWGVHQYSSENMHLKNAITKYGWVNLVKQIILISDRAYCELIEEKLRPENNIGWNIIKGGKNPPIHTGDGHHFFGKGHLMRAENCQFFKGPIVATNEATGEKRVYYGNSDLENAGFQQPNVSKCVLGKRDRHLGHTFKHLKR